MKSNLGYKFLEFLEDKGKKKVPFKYRACYAPDTFKKEDLHIKGDLELLRVKHPVTLPDNLTVTGQAMLFGRTITKLPEKFTVGERLMLFETDVKEIPSDLRVGNTLKLSSSPIKDFPDDLVLPKTVYISGLFMQTLKGDWSRVEHLHIEDMYIQSFPKNLKNLKSLEIVGYRLKELPDNLNLEHLSIGFTERHASFEIPKNLNVINLTVIRSHWEEMYGGTWGIKKEIQARGGNVVRVRKE